MSAAGRNTSHADEGRERVFVAEVSNERSGRA